MTRYGRDTTLPELTFPSPYIFEPDQDAELGLLGASCLVRKQKDLIEITKSPVFQNALYSGLSDFYWALKDMDLYENIYEDVELNIEFFRAPTTGFRVLNYSRDWVFAEVGKPNVIETSQLILSASENKYLLPAPRDVTVPAQLRLHSSICVVSDYSFNFYQNLDSYNNISEQPIEPNRLLIGKGSSRYSRGSSDELNISVLSQPGLYYTLQPLVVNGVNISNDLMGRSYRQVGTGGMLHWRVIVFPNSVPKGSRNLFFDVQISDH